MVYYLGVTCGFQFHFDDWPVTLRQVIGHQPQAISPFNYKKEELSEVCREI